MRKLRRIRCVRGLSASRDVVVGFAPARLLFDLSFADVLDEQTGRGYQRRFSKQHSLDFRRYIQKPRSTTIPLTFNLRPQDKPAWRLVPASGDAVDLVISPDAGKILAQVDCQHRLGYIGDLDVELPFMIYVELSETDEMVVFNTINGKAKGLSGSLLDLHEARLARDLADERPELLIALRMSEADSSPWLKQLDLGGKATSGLHRRASLRTMQRAVKRFLTATGILETMSVSAVADLVIEFWIAVATVLRREWAEPRRHFLTKGVGVYALMGILADLFKEASASRQELTATSFVSQLADFAPDFDWSTTGPFRGLGGQAGVREALALLRAARSRLGAAVRA